MTSTALLRNPAALKARAIPGGLPLPGTESPKVPAVAVESDDGQGVADLLRSAERADRGDAVPRGVARSSGAPAADDRGERGTTGWSAARRTGRTSGRPGGREAVPAGGDHDGGR